MEVVIWNRQQSGAGVPSNHVGFEDPGLSRSVACHKSAGFGRTANSVKSGKTGVLTLVNGRSSSVMRSNRELV